MNTNELYIFDTAKTQYENMSANFCSRQFIIPSSSADGLIMKKLYCCPSFFSPVSDPLELLLLLASLSDAIFL